MATKIITLDLPDSYTREDVIAELRAWADAMERALQAAQPQAAPPEAAPPEAPRRSASVVYVIAPGGMTKHITGQSATLRDEIARRGEATARDLEEVTGLKRKSVESGLWQLRHHGVIQSVPRTDA